ncbi:MAG: hypothetical protein A4E55_02229 [Pelotomaculum sp. PtaU1.Bin035]|nr:MAG: hypothetical protein A4E55_02229 [Pelotomaculum sp. PtaU1.Bin035]
MKKYIFNFIAILSMLSFFVGYNPTSIGNFYQPELPDELK